MSHRVGIKVGAIAGAVLVCTSLAGCGDDGGKTSAVKPLFELTTKEMSAEAVAALPATPVAADVANLGAGESPGYLYAVWDPARGVHLAAVGLAEIAGSRAMTTSDSFRIGSITKTFTATAVLLLVDEGKVDLDKPVATYTGELTKALPGGDTATVRQLLGMQSGWPEYSNSPEGPFGKVLTDPNHQFTAQELVDAAAGESPTPAGKVTYVNTNFVVLGELVAKVSGKSFSAFVKQRILDPVGLTHTIIPDQTATAEVSSHGYFNASWADFGPDAKVPADVLAAGGAGTDVTKLSTSVGGTAGNGVSTLADLARWATADFGNVLLSEATRTARLTGAEAGDIVPWSSYGLGLETMGDWHFHGGEIFGWESELFANPTTGQVVILNANACCGIGLKNLMLVTGTFPDDEAMAQLQNTLQFLQDN